MDAIEELDVKVLPVALESHEQEAGISLASEGLEIRGHRLEGSHTDQACSGCESDTARGCEPRSDAGEAARSDVRRHDVQLRLGQT
jgi:hypothetical protein